MTENNLTLMCISVLYKPIDGKRKVFIRPLRVDFELSPVCSGYTPQNRCIE